ncbi:MAG: amphi-Trp domain-containing protein [Anaerolineae bacterium]
MTVEETVKEWTTLFESTERKEIQEIASFLQQLANKLRKGDSQIALSRGENNVTVELPDRMLFDVVVEEKPRKLGAERRLTLTITWDEERTAEETTTLT